MKDLTDKEWGLVLNGGGGKGAYQIGVFDALTENGLYDKIVAVAGSSSGALNTVLFANGDMKAAKEAWSEVLPEDFLMISPDMIDFKEGLVPREGLLKILNKYIDLEKIRLSDKLLYCSVSDFGPEGNQSPVAKYYSLNYKNEADIKDILLASSALPIIYSPIKINGNVCKDGGLTNNMPIKPLYIEGIRHFIVIGLSNSTSIPYEKYPDAEFLLINPDGDIGDFFDGTLDFSRDNIKTRIKIGYYDALRRLEFYGEDMSLEEVKFRYNESVKRDYNKIKTEDKKDELETMVNSDMDKLKSIYDKFGGI